MYFFAHQVIEEIQIGCVQVAQNSLINHNANGPNVGFWSELRKGENMHLITQI
jgi:hypothetical protein